MAQTGYRYSNLLLVIIPVAWLLALGACTAADIVGTPTPQPTATQLPTATPEPIVPTRTLAPVATEPPPTWTPAPTATPPQPTAVPTLTAGQRETLDRFGLVGAVEDVVAAVDAGLRFGQFAFWRTSANLPDTPDLTFWQMVRLGQIAEAGQWPAIQDEMEIVLREHPGSTWLIGNEPDVRWQDNVTAEDYADLYHDIYAFIKARDPSARVAAGGIALPTPLRLRYLDTVLAHYQATYGEPLPADLWHIHTFTLREEQDSWGIGIPPGMEVTAGVLYEIEDHGNIDLLQQHVAAFRDWMAANGYADAPLAVTEFGILLPEDYGFPTEVVGRFMREAIDYFRTATGETGLAADDGRLVQYWFWYSLYDDGAYPTGNLFNVPALDVTELGEIYRAYVDEVLQSR